MKKRVKSLLTATLIILVLASVYACLPRVWYKQSRYGKPLSTAGTLSAATQKQLSLYIQDTAQNAQAVVAIQKERIILEVGDTRRLINCHSARKSIMDLLIGIAVEKGMLRLDQTLGELGIDESKTPLTHQEKTATVRDLLMAKSGVYLPAEAETDFAKANRPKRDQYKPGDFFFYNNFDFNVLGAILEKETGQTIGGFMDKYLAQPLGLQDFAPSNVVYGNPWPIRNDQSDYRVYWIFLSARDMARIGAMVSQKGVWMGKPIVSASWIEESFQPYTQTLDKSMWPFDAYGYLWWIDKDTQTYWADGFGGQFLLVDPTRGLAIAQRNFTGNSLLSSGLFLMKKRRDGSRRQLIHVYEMIKQQLD
ncbi:serine hydrolase [Siphonobacter sp. SORGH_AS_1065]|uniref:serine hydrolase domain-containing protein n=1 Tax=Siphonobacter sp. SORGH_AS_1065 TaxID=3041795 RepID=UPI002786619D|nr:serine hydrolase [Siphonobacter sp. SORGH_AS_1065]MDQ1088762.1 CubicO group peptidase (beta-lactamase class C family) [Siphonobacter sp. SORGH_AS_1065]